MAGAAEPVAPTFNVSNTQVTEGDNVYAEFTVTVQGDRKQQTTFNLGNEEGSAKLTTDYTAQYEVQQADGTWQKLTPLPHQQVKTQRQSKCVCRLLMMLSQSLTSSLNLW